MKLRRILVVLAFLLTFFAMVLSSQQPPQPKVLKLSDASALELRNLQWEQAKTAVKLYQLQQEMQKLSDHSQELSTHMMTLKNEALKKSGFDSAKYDLDLDTLVVSEKPVKK